MLWFEGTTPAMMIRVPVVRSVHGCFKPGRAGSVAYRWSQVKGHCAINKKL